MTADLVAFLRARLDEDRKVAFEAGNGGYDEWIYNPKLVWNSDAGPREAVVRFNGSALGYVAAVDPVHGKYGSWNAQHIARHDPPRVLAEVDARRRMLDAYEMASQAERTAPYEDMRNVSGAKADSWRFALRLLAVSYREHSDYRPEWAPDA